MSIGKLIVGAVVIGGLVLAASALSQPARPKLQVGKGYGENNKFLGWQWQYVDTDGTVIARSTLPYDTEEEARAAGIAAGSVNQ